jgi:4-aminobutyrate aminotransferase-like enzyme
MLTFMNQPMSAAAGLAVLDIVEEQKLAERAKVLGSVATERFRELARRYDVIGDVRGPGLFIGVDFVEDRQTKTPATAACRKAWDFAVERGLVIQFGAATGNVYKFKPPLTTPQADFDRMLEISEEIVAFIQREVDEMRRVPSVAVPATSYQ